MSKVEFSVLGKRKTLVNHAIDSHKKRIEKYQKQIQDEKQWIKQVQSSLSFPKDKFIVDFTGYKKENILKYKINPNLLDFYVTNNIETIVKEIQQGHHNHNPFGRFYNEENKCVDIGLGTNCGFYWSLSKSAVVDETGAREPLPKDYFETINELHCYDEDDSVGLETSLQDYIISVVANGYYYLLNQNTKGEYQYHEDRIYEKNRLEELQKKQQKEEINKINDF